MEKGPSMTDHSPAPEPPDSEDTRRPWLTWTTRALWLAGMTFLILQVFQPEKPALPPMEPLFGGQWEGRAAAADNATTSTALSARAMHSSGHDLEARQREALRRMEEESRLPELTGENLISFADMKETVLHNLPPPVYTEKLKELDGRTVRMVGFMSPYDSLTDLRNFMLVEAPTGCFFCAPPGPLQVVFVGIDAGSPLDFIDEPVLVEGRLRLWKEDSNHHGHRSFLFVIDQAKVSAL